MPTKTAKKRPSRHLSVSKSARKPRTKKLGTVRKFSLYLRSKPAPKKHLSAKTRKKISESLIKRYSRNRGAISRKTLLIGFLVVFGVIGSYFLYRSFAYTTMVGADGEYTSLTPARILDTRDGTGGISTPVGAGKTVTLQVTGQGGVPASYIKAVTVNITVTEPTAGSYLVAWPTGLSKPTASSINFAKGQTIAKALTVAVGSDGKIQIYNASGSVQVIVDVAGFYSSADGQAGTRFNAVSPSRILDTRTGLGSPKAPIGTGKTISVSILGRGGIPANGVRAVVLNLTAVSPTTGSYLTVWPSGVVKPTASSINFAAGQTVANQITVPVGPDGKIQIFNAAGSVNALLDVSGYFEDISPGYEKTQEGRFVPLNPARILDTRTAAGGGAIGSAKTASQHVASLGGLPYDNMRAVVLNVTVTGPTAGGYITVWPSGIPKPTASSINFATGQTIANQVTVPVGADGKVNVFNATGSTHVIFDVAGYYYDNNSFINIADYTSYYSNDATPGSKIEYTVNLEAFEPDGRPRFQVYPSGSSNQITFEHVTSPSEANELFIWCAYEGTCQSLAPGAIKGGGTSVGYYYYTVPYAFTAPASYKIKHEVLVDQPGYAGPWEFISITNAAGVKTDLLAQQRDSRYEYSFKPFRAGAVFNAFHYANCKDSKLSSASLSNLLLDGLPRPILKPYISNSSSSERALCPGSSRIEYNYTGQSDTTTATLKGGIPKASRSVVKPIIGTITPNYTNKTVTINTTDESGLTDLKADVDGFSIYHDYSDGNYAYAPPFGKSFTDTLSLQGISSGVHTLHITVTDIDGVQSEKTVTITIPNS